MADIYIDMIKTKNKNIENKSELYFLYENTSNQMDMSNVLS